VGVGGGGGGGGGDCGGVTWCCFVLLVPISTISSTVSSDAILYRVP